jgi:hypothetical protein
VILLAVTTYDTVANKRDMSDIITNISPFDTYLYSHLGSMKATARFHEWLEDSLGDPRENAQSEGFTYFTEETGDRLPLGNYCQIMSRGVHVTNTQEVVLKYGLRSEMAYQMSMKLKELALDCEMALLTQDNMSAGSKTPPIPRRFAGLPFWIQTNVFANGGTTRPLTLDLINLALEETYKQGGNPKVLMVSPRNKSIISRFTAETNRNMSRGEQTIGTIVSRIETDFGVLSVVPNRWMKTDRIYGLSMEYIKKAFLRPFAQHEVTPNVADMKRKNITGEWTLEMRAEKAHFVIKDLDGTLPVFEK